MYEDIVSFSSEGENLPFYASMCGISYCDGSYNIKRENSSIYVIEYIASGVGTVKEDNKTFEASEGDVYFLKQNKKHYYYSDKENPWVKIWMNFSGPLADYITKCYFLEDLNHFYAPELKCYFDKIIDIAKSKKDVITTNNELAEVFLKIAQKLYFISEQQEKKDTVAKKLKNIIDSLDSFDNTLEKIIEPLYCSKNHAIRQFKKEYSVSPYEYIQIKRFKMAKNMLKNTAMSISDIAEKLNFYDIHYFSGCFKKRFGITPLAYRKK